MTLSLKRRRFVEEYLVDLNATQAAIRAGYSAKTAGQQGERLLKYAEVAEAVQTAMDERSERTEITQDMVLRGLLTEAELKGEGSSHAARVSAWKALGEHLALFTQNLRHTGDVNVNVMRFTASDAGRSAAE